jgi:hypothetical protein
MIVPKRRQIKQPVQINKLIWMEFPVNSYSLANEIKKVNTIYPSKGDTWIQNIRPAPHL